MSYTRIIGSGSAVPDNVVTNAMMEAIVETSDEWIQSRTGIVERRISTDQNTSDLAYLAAKRAMEAAAVDAKSIDLLIVATVTPDMPFPGVSQLLQRKLNMHPITAFDVNAACSGFIYAINVADAMIRSGSYRRALVIGAETLTKITDFTDRNTCVLFGDAAGAVVIEPSDTPGIERVITRSKGDHEGLLTLEGYPLKQGFKTPQKPWPFLQMQGSEVFKFATRAMPEIINDLLSQSSHTMDDIALVVAHQANRRIIESSGKKLRIPEDKLFMNIEHYGNTSAASVPLAIDEAIRSNRLKKGDLFLTVAFGAGLTWGGALIRL